jgi:hypothetical protein
MNETAKLTEGAGVGASDQRLDGIRWRALWRLEKRSGDWTPEQIDAGLAPAPYETIEREGNLLVYGGASALWDLLIGAGNVTEFDNSNAHIGVGDSNTAAAATQTDLQATTNKLRKAMDSTYPQHTDGVVEGSASVVFRSTFGSSDANFQWREWAIFNASSSGRMLNRKVEDLGTKASGSTWTLTVTLSLS